VKPLLHDEVQFHNGNCTIRFEDDDEEEFDIPFSTQSHHDNHNAKSIIRTSNMSPGEIFTSVLDKYDTKSNGNL
jgi:hypothetical protein